MKIRKFCAVCMLIALLVGSACAEEKSFAGFCSEIKLESADTQAWLEIPGTNISHPVMQHAHDDAYYLDHDPHGNQQNYGALYTESRYNAFDFSDPVTVIYGHRMNNGSMFGTLQKYYSGGFNEYRTINLYMPDGTKREYTVFAAILAADTHILNYHNFTSMRVFNRYFDEVYATRKLGIMLDHQLRPEPEDQVIILSTCIKGDASQRYLVMAKLSNETNGERVGDSK